MEHSLPESLILGANKAVWFTSCADGLGTELVQRCIPWQGKGDKPSA